MMCKGWRVEQNDLVGEGVSYKREMPMALMAIRRLIIVS